MADRIDLLGRDGARERLLADGLLEVAIRSDLSEFVHRAAETSSYPISIVSLMGRRSQFFVASTGLPSELEVIGGTDRSISLCQRVVRDNQPFEWEDAALDEAAPQGMVNAYGVRAYFGAPIVVHHVVIGSLCVVDTAPRALEVHQREAIEALAGEISVRLERDAHALLRTRVWEVEADAVEPIFGELRNLLVPLSLGVSEATITNAEIQTALRLLRVPDGAARSRAESVLRDTLRSGEDLDAVLAELRPTSDCLVDSIKAIESLFHRSAQHKPIARCVADAKIITEHVVKLVGGVRVELRSSPDAQAVARTLIPAIALLLGVGARRLLDRRATGGLLVRTLDIPGGVRIEIEAPGWTDDDATFCANHAAPLLTHEPSLVVSAAGRCVGLEAKLGARPIVSAPAPG